jgi:HPt (histidine-containing phosphotransfer) domain-containing protein
MAKDVKDKSPAPRIETFADHAVITPHNSLKHAIRTTGSRGGAPDNDDPVARAESALAGLSSEFKSWMHAECDRLAAAHTAVIAKGFNTLTRGELFRAAHDIKGDAPTFGFPAAGVAADSLCRLIEHAPDLDAVPAGLIQLHVDAVQAIVREHNTIETAGVADELCRRLRAVAGDYLAEANKDRPEHLDALAVPSIAP